jgi:hypothetical protein
MLQKTTLWALVGITFLVVAMYIAFQISQWPSVLCPRAGSFSALSTRGSIRKPLIGLPSVATLACALPARQGLPVRQIAF